ncbi:MAG: hypothetical protein K0R27_5233 [Xanthobacteraceae bacterium]|nr:hypothetical protein [Xanthobacteraceae bacterium]
MPRQRPSREVEKPPEANDKPAPVPCGRSDRNNNKPIRGA